MVKRDYKIVALLGLITAIFLSIILINTNVHLSFRGYTLPLWAFYFLLPVLESFGYALASGLFRHVAILRQAGRFGIVGLMNFSVDTGILSFLSRITGIYSGIGIIPLNTISASIAIVNSYYWNRNWTFTNQGRASGGEFFKFLIVIIGGIIINSALVYVFTTYSLFVDSLTPERLEIIAKITATVISLFWNFFGLKFVVFKS